MVPFCIPYHRGDEPDAVAHLLDADLLTSRGLAEIDFAAVEADAPAGSDGDRLIIEG